MARGEQITQRGQPSIYVKGKRHKDWRWFEKRAHARAVRREGRLLLDDAPPPNRFRGWAL